MRAWSTVFRALVACTVLTASWVAQASSESLAGTYTKADHGVNAQVDVTPIGASRAKVSIDIGVPNCAGHVDGVGEVHGRTIALSVPNGMDGLCRVSMTFDGRTFRMNESSCLAFHGAACDFEESGSGVFHHHR